MAHAERPSPHYPLPDPSTDLNVQEFLEWIDQQSYPGVTFVPNGFRPAKFLPDRAMQEYCDCKQADNLAKFRRLVAAASAGSSVTVDAGAVAKRCPKVFAILVMIGQSKYLNSFVTKDNLRDRRLPFAPEVRKLFPRLPNGESFFDEFYQKQWQFCVEPLSYGLEPLTFDKDRILPIIEMVRLDKHRGASAEVRKIRVHPDYDELAEHMPFGPSHQAESHEYVIKSYHSVEARKYFQAEVDAFQKLNGSGEPMHNLIGFYGAFEQNNSFHVILEYANIGTLEDYLENFQPPKEGNDILNLWNNLFEVNHTLVRIHAPGDSHEPSSYQRPRIFQGWHQDIKPANILVAGEEDNPYAVRFMLADLGLSHFTAVFEDRAGVTGEDTHGARAYRAPECNLAQSPVSNFSPRVKQCIDTWSLACVYSEVNTWIVDGWKHGLLRYRNERQIEAAASSSSLGACFHSNKGELLNKVIQWHTETMPKRCATEDKVTKVIWEELLKYMFVPHESRIGAQQVVAYSEYVIKRAQDMLKPAPTRTQTAPAAAVTTVRDTDRPRTPPNIPPEFQDPQSRGRNHQNYPMTPPYDNTLRQPKVSELDSMRILSHSPDSMNTDSTTPGANGNRESLNSVMSENYDHGGTLDSNADPVSLTSSAYFGGSRVTLFAEQERMSRSGFGAQLPLGTNGVRQDQPPGEMSTLSRSSTMPPRAGRHLRSISTTVNQDLARDLSVARLDEEVEGKGKGKGKGKSVERALSTKKRTQRSTKVLTVDELKHWAEMTRISSHRAFLGPGKEYTLPFEAELIGELRERDHIFVIDDGESMRPHWKSVVALYKDLIYMVKKKHLDPNGSELQFITSEKHKEKRDTTELVAMVSAMQYNLQGESNFASRLDKILQAYKAKLEKKPNTRPISLYVFTDGKWQSGKGQLREVARAIEHIVTFLETTQAPDKKVGIQLIRLGNDDVGKERLRYLDADLPKANNLPQDICDTTSADGNVWKMMLGSINSTWDGDEDD